MAYLVVNSRYNPFSYDELVKPLADYTEAYNEQAEALSKLETDASTLASALSETNDPIAYNTYKNYLAEVQNAAADIAQNGLSPSSRQNVLNLAGSYARDIIPIQGAYNRRKELQDEQRKALLSNPTLYFQRNFNNPVGEEASIDRFVEDPNYSYGNFFSGALLEKQVSDAASNLSKALQNYGVGKHLDAYTKTFLQQHGYSPEQVLDAINNPNRATSQPVLNSIVESVIGSSGVLDWGDANAIDVAYANARRGLFSAVGQSSVSPMEDFGARHAATTQNQPPTMAGLPITPLNIHTQTELSEARKNYNSYNNLFEQLPDGSLKLTDEGRAEYDRNATPRVTVSGSGSGTAALMNLETKYNANGSTFTKTPFRAFIDNIQQPGETIEEAWSRYLNENDEARYDAKYITEYDFNYNPSQQASIKQSMITANGGKNFDVVEFDRATNSWKPVDKISAEEFAKKDYEVARSRFSYGDSQVMVNHNGEVLRIRLPRGINTVAESNRDEEGKIALIAQQNINTLLEDGYYTTKDGRKIEPQTKEEFEDAYMKFLESYQNAITNAYLYHSQLGLENDLKEMEYNPYIMR